MQTHAAALHVSAVSVLCTSARTISSMRRGKSLLTVALMLLTSRSMLLFCSAINTRRSSATMLPWLFIILVTCRSVRPQDLCGQPQGHKQEQCQGGRQRTGEGGEVWRGPLCT